MLGRGEERPRKARRWTRIAAAVQGPPTVFLILRRMRAPLIVLITIFAISVLGLTLVPGRDETGQPARMGFFDAFYFMSYTATTIGYGEIPHEFTGAQRLWVMASIYLTVIGWAYAIGSLLTLLQDRAFRQALALQRFTRTVARIREPFLLIAGYGQTGQLLGRSLDALGRRLVVVDSNAERVDALDIDAYRADVPGLAGDARNPQTLEHAGLGHPYCEGVLALTDDDEVNLAVAMTAALVRPELPVIARTVSPAVGYRMAAFGSPTVVNAFDRYGDHLRLALRAPASYQLMVWLESGLGATLPDRAQPPRAGRWVLCGYGRFGRELTEDLHAEGLTVTVIDIAASADPDPWVVVGDGSEPSVMARADLAHAVGFVAGTDNDTTNLSLVAAARRINPHLFVASRQNRPETAPLFAAMRVDSLLVPAEVVAHEIYAQLSTPLLWHFLREMPALGDRWAANMITRLHKHCGRRLHGLWRTTLDADEAPALIRWLRDGRATLRDLLRHPDDRDERLDIVPLLILRDEQATLGPADDAALQAGDQILFAGQPWDRRALLDTLTVDSVSQYVLYGRRVPSSWVWQRLTHSPRSG
ncbi:potassium channel protein [Actinoplanes sp. NEAU-A11]|uniref:Potassium channel protein n=2 Tax=Actinoplanes aureus TaxID=2792083 RepID=A0A931G5Z3_9ACTN|nr:potassium channel protein [Actinoplanes aureus]